MALRVVVVSVGRLRPPFEDDVAHYRRLLSRYVRLEEVELRDQDAVGRRLPVRAYTVLLDAAGRARSSEDFARWLEGRRQEGRDLAFVIGGAFGAPPLEHVDERLSLGPQTMAHQLARVVLLEQLYRGHRILAGEPYHH